MTHLQPKLTSNLQAMACCGVCSIVIRATGIESYFGKRREEFRTAAATPCFLQVHLGANMKMEACGEVPLTGLAVGMWAKKHAHVKLLSAIITDIENKFVFLVGSASSGRQVMSCSGHLVSVVWLCLPCSPVWLACKGNWFRPARCESQHSYLSPAQGSDTKNYGHLCPKRVFLGSIESSKQA